MPRSKTGTRRRPVDLEALKRAVIEVIENGKSMHTAAKMHNVSKTTLNRHIECHRNAGNVDFVYENRLKTRQVFTDAEEIALKEYILTITNLNYGLSKDDLLKYAFDFAQANAKQIPPNWIREKKPSRNWFKSFRHRHPNIILGEPEATTSFSNAKILTFFKNYKDCLVKFWFNPDSIYNIDETMYPKFQSSLPEVLSQGRDKQTGCLSSDERGIGVTMIAAINAAGNHVPPMLIFPQVNFEEHMLIGAPPGTIGAANSNGLTTAELFLKYLKHFIAFVKPSSEKSVLLIMDNHDTHISIGAINEAKRNNVVLLAFPPYTSHKLQPLDRTIFGAYRTFFKQAENEWMLNYPGRAITIYDIATVIGKAFPKAFSPTNIIRAFKVSGIWPLNENVFGHGEFLSSYNTGDNIGAATDLETSEPEKFAITIKEEVFNSSHTFSSQDENSFATTKNHQPVEVTDSNHIEPILEAKDEPNEDFEAHSNLSIPEVDVDTSHTETAQGSILSENKTGDEFFQDEEEQETKWTQIQDALTTMQDDVHFIRNHIETNSTRDEFSIFGDLIAHKLRSCKRSYSAITNAQSKIANIVYNLTMGEVESVDEDPPPGKNTRNGNILQTSSTEKIESNPSHSIVIKEENNP